MRNPRVIQEGIPAENNLKPRGNQEGMLKKPDTESPSVQGMSEYANPSKPVVNPPLEVSQPLGYSPLEEHKRAERRIID